MDITSKDIIHIENSIKFQEDLILRYTKEKINEFKKFREKMYDKLRMKKKEIESKKTCIIM